MRPSYALMMLATALLASAETALAIAKPTELSHATTADLVQPNGVMMNALPSKRLLRAAKGVELNQEDEEERTLERLKSFLPQSIVEKIQGGHLSGSYVKKLLNSETARTNAFEYMAGQQTTVKQFGAMLNLKKANRQQLKDLYAAYLVRNP